MKNKNIRTTFLILLTALAFALVACATTQSVALKHPTPIEGMPICSDCHTDWRASLSHTADFDTRHRFWASTNVQSCAMCHEEAFCSDCHAHKEELKPSDKYKDSPERDMPHRGDYLNQHKIDGRVNPVSCFPCHGRQNNERCKTCHR